MLVVVVEVVEVVVVVGADVVVVALILPPLPVKKKPLAFKQEGFHTPLLTLFINAFALSNATYL